MTSPGSPAALVSPSMTFGGLLLAVAVITFLIYSERPAVNRRTVVAFVPWMVAASALYVFSSMVQYPSLVRPLVGARGAYFSTYLVLGSAWFAMLQFSGGAATDDMADYISAMGFGTATVLVAFVLLHADTIAVTRLAWLLVVPVAAGFAGFAVLLLLGLWYIDAPAYAGVAGGLVVFGQTLEAVSTAFGLGLFGAIGHTYLSWKVLDWVVAFGVTEFLPVDNQLLVWACGYIWVKIALATVAVVALTRLVRERPSWGYLLLGLVAAVGITRGVTNIFLIAVGGLP